MSILTDLMAKKITFSQAVTEVESWGANVLKNDPTATAAVGAVTSDLKQAASDAVTIAESDLQPFIAPAAAATSVALEAALAGLTKGVSLPFNPLITAGIDTIANAVNAEVQAWAAQAKASLVATPAK